MVLADTVVIAVFAASAGALADTAPTASRLLAAAAGLGAAMVPLLRPAWSGQALRNWTRARSVSEALKSEVFLWLAKAGPYRNDPTAAELLHKTSQARADVADLASHRDGIVPEEPSLPPVHDIASYFSVRVAGQVDAYYRPRAAKLAKVLRRFRRAELGLAVLAAAIGAAAGVVGGSNWSAWIAVITTIGAALAAHVGATRHEYQLIAYQRTAEHLDLLSARAASASDVAELDVLAVSAERLITMENQGWMAKLAEDPPDVR